MWQRSWPEPEGYENKQLWNSKNKIINNGHVQQNINIINIIF